MSFSLYLWHIIPDNRNVRLYLIGVGVFLHGGELETLLFIQHLFFYNSYLYTTVIFYSSCFLQQLFSTTVVLYNCCFCTMGVGDAQGEPQCYTT